MKHPFYLTVLTLAFAFTTKAQTGYDRFISQEDSIQLSQFWKGFKQAVDGQDKAALSRYFSFPFYCSPCLDYINFPDSLDNNPPPTVKVTGKIFAESVYKLFFEIPNRNRLTAKLWADDFVFMPSFNDRNKRDGFQFSFALVPPSKKWEGSQAFVYIQKRRGKFFIAGVDQVP